MEKRRKNLDFFKVKRNFLSQQRSVGDREKWGKSKKKKEEINHSHIISSFRDENRFLVGER